MTLKIMFSAQTSVIRGSVHGSQTCSVSNLHDLSCSGDVSLTLSLTDWFPSDHRWFVSQRCCCLHAQETQSDRSPSFASTGSNLQKKSGVLLSPDKLRKKKKICLSGCLYTAKCDRIKEKPCIQTENVWIVASYFLIEGGLIGITPKLYLFPLTGQSFLSI